MSITQREMTDAFIDALKWASANKLPLGGSSTGGGGSAPSSTPSGSSGVNPLDALKKEGGAAAGAITGLGKAGLDISESLLIGGARVKDATNALKNNFQGLDRDGSILGKSLKFVSEGADKLGVHLDENIDTWRNLSKTGASFGNDIISMKEQASNARMTLRELSEVVQTNTSNLAGLGPTMSQSIKVFTGMSNDFFKSGLGENLRQMGYQTKDLNDILAVNLSNRRITDLQTAAGQKRALESAAALATEMDAVAKITGKNKEEQLRNLRSLQEDGQAQAALQLMIRKGGEGVRDAFNSVYTSAAKGGDEFQRMTKEFVTMGRPSEAMRDQFALAGEETRRYLAEARAATLAGDKKRADEAMALATEAYLRNKQSTTQLTLAANAVGSTAESYKSALPSIRAMEAAGGSIDKLGKQVDAAQKGLEVDPKTGERISRDATKQITEFAVNIESRGRDVTKALTDNLIIPLTEKVGPRLKTFNDQLKDPKFIEDLSKQVKTGRIRGEASGSVMEALTDKETVAKLNSAISSTDKNAAEVTKLSELLRSESNKDKIAAKLDELAKKQGTDVQTVINNAMANKGAGVASLNRELESVLTAEDKRRMANEKTETEKRKEERRSSTVGRAAAADIAGGRDTTATFGESVGKAIADVGLFISKPGLVTIDNLNKRAEGGYVSKPEITSLAEEGPEFVLNQPQMKSLIQGIGQSSSIDISKISKEITTTISSVSGGNATTVKGPDLSRNSSKELLKAQGIDPDAMIAEAKKPSLSNLSFGPNGMPVFRQAEAAKQGLPDRSPEKAAEDSREARRVASQREQATAKAPDERTTTATAKPASLDDVVKQLDHLNKLMNQFVADHKEIGTKQIRAARSIGSSNINERI